jgi:hypothetical protein
MQDLTLFDADPAMGRFGNMAKARAASRTNVREFGKAAISSHNEVKPALIFREDTDLRSAEQYVVTRNEITGNYVLSAHRLFCHEFF